MRYLFAVGVIDVFDPASSPLLGLRGNVLLHSLSAGFEKVSQFARSGLRNAACDVAGQAGGIL